MKLSHYLIYPYTIINAHGTLTKKYFVFYKYNKSKMKLLHKKFYYALTWNSIESVIYQLLLLSHQILLFHTVGSEKYGLIGFVFSFIYLSIALVNFGFDDSIAPFFSLATINKHNFKRLFIPQICFEIIILVSYSIFLFFMAPALVHKIPIILHNPMLLYLICGIIISEGMKKTMRSFLHIAFVNKKTTVIELATIMMYITTVWAYYLLGFPITFSLLLIPLFFTSCVGSIILGYTIYQWFKQLPNSKATPITTHIIKRIIKNRFFAYLIQLNHQFFSGNFLVPLFALQCGLQCAAVVKLASHIIHTISSIINKIIGPTSVALLAHYKNKDLIEKRKAFFIATGSIHQLLYAFFIFFFINYKKLILFCDSPHVLSYWPFIFLFMTIHFSEHFFTIYEKFYITEEKIEYLLLLHCITTASMYTAINHAFSPSPLIILISIACIRIVSFITLQYLSFYLWKLSPNFAIQPRYFIASLILSFAVFTLV